MIRIPESPRHRRRLKWVTITGALVAAGVLTAVLIPSKGPSRGAATGDSAPAQLAIDTHQRLSRADRRAIDTLLDRFIPAAVGRGNLRTAWALAGPEMRSSSSLAAFRRGNLPVPSYPANEKNYHHWRAIDVERNSVVLNILVHPKNPTTRGTWVFSIDVTKSRGAWLVNHIYPIAVMNPPVRAATVTHELGPADYAAPPPTQQTSTTSSPSSRSYLLPVAGIFAILLLIPLALGATALVRARRWRRSVRASGRTELPPLPSSYRGGAEEQKELASHP